MNDRPCKLYLNVYAGIAGFAEVCCPMFFLPPILLVLLIGIERSVPRLYVLDINIQKKLIDRLVLIHRHGMG